MKRWVVSVLSVLLIFSLSAVARSASDTPQRGGTLTMGIYRELEHMNPLVGTRSIDEDLRTLMFEPLIGVDLQDNLRPGLAESWEASGDGRTYTFKLRRGVRFHDGQETSAEDVKFSMDYTMNPKNGAFGFNQLALVDRVEAADKYTMKVFMKRPSAALLSSLTQITTFSVIPKGSLSEGGDKPARYPPGTGPFKFVEWKPNQHIIFERFDGYWGHKALLEKLVLVPITDDSVRMTALRAGNVNMIERTPREWMREIVDGKVKGIGFAQAPYSTFRRIIFNAAAPPFDNKKLRQAVAHALDRKEILQAAYFGFGEPNDQKYPKGHQWYIEGVAAPAHDLDKARVLLKEAGYRGEPIEVIVIQSAPEQAAATALQAQLKKIGMPLRLTTMDSGAANSRYRKGDFALRFSGTSLFSDPYPMYGPGFICEADRNRRATNSSGYCDKQLDALFQKLEAEMDPPRRKDLLRQVLRKLVDDVPELFIGFVPEFFTFQDRVKGFATNDDGNFRWWGGGLNHTWLDR
jgi:peptide/nickel transport system substrate-binding protein